jgi:hypothetical protein
MKQPGKKNKATAVSRMIASVFFLLLAGFTFAQMPGLNQDASKARYYMFDFRIPERSELSYDESKVPEYTLPDPLVCNDGTRVTTVKQWEQQRRPELLEFFSSQMYGRTPKEKIKVTYETLSENPDFFNGKATGKQVKFIFTNGHKNVEAILLLVLPNSPKGKAPVFVSYNYGGNHTTCFEPSIEYPPSFSFLKTSDEPAGKPGSGSDRWPYEQILDRGYGIATMYFEDIYHDYADFDRPYLEEHTVATLFSDYDPADTKADKWQALGAWAWGSSRIVDYLETQDRVDSDKIIIMGHSRHGKAALWAGAQDERFKIVISNNSGSCGAALSKRVFGESIARIMRHPHWFCPYFSRYAHHEADLPFDQHELIALIAPRHVYIASAEEDYGADPKGEFLSGYHAGPVYELFGLKGLGVSEQPPVNKPVMHDMGYHVRTGGHNVTDYDWARYMDFADKHFGKK